MKTLFFKLFTICMLMLLSSSSFSQILVVHYNADWNDANKVEWIDKLSDCEISKVDIVKEPKLQKKHEIVVVPTIIVFKDGEEVKRFQADISFSMKATRKEVQGIIDEQNLSDF